MSKSGFEVTDHVLVPKHVKASEKEKKALFEKFNISIKELPKIHKSDPAIADLEVQAGDIVKVMRKSATAKDSAYYRGVV
jgi:DNA-directed RNA polymerase subunit H